MEYKEKQQLVKDTAEKAAKVLTEEIPSALLYDYIGKHVASALEELSSDSTYLKKDGTLDGVVRSAVLDRAKEMLKNDFKDEIEELAKRLARDTVAIARQLTFSAQDWELRRKEAKQGSTRW